MASFCAHNSYFDSWLSSILHFSTLKKWAFWLAAVTKGSAAEAVAPHFVLGADDGQKIRPICACSARTTLSLSFVYYTFIFTPLSFGVWSHIFVGQLFPVLLPSEVGEICPLWTMAAWAYMWKHCACSQNLYCMWLLCLWYLLLDKWDFKSKVFSAIHAISWQASCVYFGLLGGSSLLFWPNLFVLRWKLCFAQVSSVLSSAIFGFS